MGWSSDAPPLVPNMRSAGFGNHESHSTLGVAGATWRNSSWAGPRGVGRRFGRRAPPPQLPSDSYSAPQAGSITSEGFIAPQVLPQSSAETVLRHRGSTCLP
eukprot:6420617-Pyramimonas_sp.AAC.1